MGCSPSVRATAPRAPKTTRDELSIEASHVKRPRWSREVVDSDLGSTTTTDTSPEQPSSGDSESSDSGASSCDSSASFGVVLRLGHLRCKATSRPLPGGFTQVRRIAGAIHGEVFVYDWHRQDTETHQQVAVKKLVTQQIDSNRSRNTDERSAHFDRSVPDAEDSLGDITVLAYLAEQADRSNYLLQLRAIFTEGTQYTWLVTEFADGGDLFELVASGNRLPEAEVMRYLSQLMQAVAYLHKHQIGHRDISLENILLCKGAVRLMDFGMAVQSTASASGEPLRYFLAVGKDSYRAPECYVPATEQISALVPRGSSPGEVALVQSGNLLCEVKIPATARDGEICSLDVCGYEAQPADIFSCGICLFILGFQCPAWQEAMLSDTNFKFAHLKGFGGIEALLQKWRRPLLSAPAMELLSEMLRSQPSKRPTASACLHHAWFVKGPSFAGGA